MEQKLDIIGDNEPGFIEVDSEEYNALRWNELEGSEVQGSFGEEILRKAKFVRTIMMQQQTRADLMSLHLGSDTIVASQLGQERFDRALNSFNESIDHSTGKLKKMVEKVFVLEDFSILQKMANLSFGTGVERKTRRLIQEHYENPRFNMVYHFFEEIFCARSMRPEIVPEIMKENVFRDEWRIRLMYQFMIQNGFTPKIMREMFEVHAKDFNERRSDFLDEYRPLLETFFTNSIQRLTPYGISETQIDSRLEQTRFELIDALTIFDRDFTKTTYDLESGTVQVPDYLYLERPDSIIPKALKSTFYALAGRGAKEQQQRMLHTRLGFEEFGKNDSLSWLNETAADYLFLVCCCGIPPFSAELKDHLITLLSKQGRSPFDPGLFLKAFFENDRPEAGAKRPIWNELVKTINTSYEAGFLNQLGLLMRGQGLDTVTEIMKSGWEKGLLRNYHAHFRHTRKRPWPRPGKKYLS